jgi:hypothetical protein
MPSQSDGDFLDGWALWQEHKPQTLEDWIAVAQRSIDAEDYDPSVGSPIFQALYAAVEAMRETQTRALGMSEMRLSAFQRQTLANVIEPLSCLMAGKSWDGLIDGR